MKLPAWLTHGQCIGCKRFNVPLRGPWWRNRTRRHAYCHACDPPSKRAARFRARLATFPGELPPGVD